MSRRSAIKASEVRKHAGLWVWSAGPQRHSCSGGVGGGRVVGNELVSRGDRGLERSRARICREEEPASPRHLDTMS